MAEEATGHRVSPPRITASVERAARPPAGSPSSDAHRQTSFVLGPEVEAVLSGLQLELEVAGQSSASRYRKQVMVAALGLWSRSWLSRLQAVQAVEWGNYAAAAPLVRSAADYQAAALYVLREGGAEWQEWLDQGGVGLAADAHALEYRLHAFRAGEVLAAHESLGAIYRQSTDLTLSHFGSTLMLAGNESDPDRVLMTFGDRDFHVGLAEIVLGWLLGLGLAQLDSLSEFEGVFAPLPGPEAEVVREAAATALARRERARIEPVERSGEQRYLVHNWRRTPGTAARRLLL